MLDSVATNESASPPQPSLAMHSQCSLLLLSYLQKLLYNFFRRTRPISEVKLMMLDPSLLELSAIVGLVVETDHSCDSHLFEDGDVVFGSEVDVLDKGAITPESSLGLSAGELKATNLPGIIQFKSPFSSF